MHDQSPILTCLGYKTPTADDLAYITFLDGTTGVDGYGLRMFEGDPMAFAAGRREYGEDKDNPNDSASD